MSRQSEHLNSFGVVGGMGPASTVRFLDLILSKYRLGRDAILNSDFPQITVYTIPDTDHISELPNPQIVTNLRRAFEVFQCAQVSFAVMPCNTAHQFIPILGLESEVQILSITSAVSTSLRHVGEKKISYSLPPGRLRDPAFMTGCLLATNVSLYY